MKKIFFLLFVIGVIFVACEKESSQIMSEEQLVIRAQNPHLNGTPVTRSLKIKGEGILEYTPSEDCMYGNHLVSVHGTGNASHLGNFDLFLQYCTIIDPENGVCDAVSLPTGYQIAANGDTLFTYFTNAYDEGDQIIQEYDYYGGTGRFEDAYGHVTLYFNFDFDPEIYCPVTYTNYGEGEITY